MPRRLQVVTWTATRSFQLGSHRARWWRGSLCSVRISILKFVCLPVPKIWLFFLPRDAMRKRGLCCRPVSVGLSVTSVHCIHTAEDIVKILIRPGSPVSLVFWPTAPIPNSKANPFSGAQNTRGWENFQFSTEIAVCLGNGTRQAHGCNTLIGSHRRRIYPCRFRWPWVTPNPGFKVTVFEGRDDFRHWISQKRHETEP